MKYIPFLFINVILMALVLAGAIKINRLNKQIEQLKTREPIIIHKADNAGAEMYGRITEKEIIDGRYTVTAGAYGKFLVTKEQYEAIKVGDPIPDYLKGVGR